jgi:hypothetical protein
MNSKTLIRKALSMCLIVAVYASYSMVALAGTEKLAGELIVSGKTSAVIVNGQEAQSGRTVFSSSTITTPDSASAIISIGKVGKLELAPGTTITLSFDETGISGTLANGTVTVLGAKESVNIVTPEGTKSVTAGKSVSTGKAMKDDDDDDDDKGGAAWWIWALVFGGAIAGVVIAATSDNNRTDLGGGTTVVSPSR